MIAGLGYWGYQGYHRWFSTKDMVAVGTNGYYYDLKNECFIKPIPNRRVLKGCSELNFTSSDTIGVVCVSTNKYRYVNLNTLTFINEMEYYKADLFKDGKAIALANDTLYIISTDGKIVSAEYADWVYSLIEEIEYTKEESDSDGFTFYRGVPSGVYMYRDSHFNYGLMSANFVRLTKPVFSSITAQSKDVFFCEYLDSGLGALIDRNGNIIK